MGQSFGVSGALTNEGATTIASGAILTAGTMSAAGSAGTLVFGVTSSSSFGQLVISGGAINLTNETVTVNVPGGNTLSDGEAIEIASGTSAVVGGPGATPTLVSDNSGTWDFTLVNGIGSGVNGATADQLYLLVQNAANQTITINSASSTPETLETGDSLSVTNAGSIVVGSGSAVTTSAAANSIDNAGLIEGPTGITVSGGSVSSITNEATGTIEGTSGTAIALTGLTASTPITINGGSIIGNVMDNVPGNGYSPTTIAGNFTTGGNFTVSSFTVDSGATLTLSSGNTLSSHTAISDAGTIVSAGDNSSVLTGGLHVTSTGSLSALSSTSINGAFTNEGATSIATSAVLTASTMSAASSAGTLTFGVASDTSHGELVISAGAANLTNETVSVNVTNGASLAGGDRILVIQGTSTLIDGPGSTPISIADNDARYSFSLVDGIGSGVSGATADQAYLEVALASPAALAVTPNNQAAATAIATAGASDPQLAAIQNNLNNAATPAAVNQVLEATTPTVDGSAPIAAQNVSGNTFNLEAVRLADLNAGDLDGSGDGTGMAAGDALQGVGMWGQAFGAHSNQDERDNIAGYSANTFGAAMGIDTRNISDKATLGVGLSYGNTDAKSRNANDTKTTTNSYQLSIYGDYDFARETYLDGLIGYSFNDIDTTRHNVGGVSNLTANGSTNANQFSGQAELGRHYAVQTGNIDTILTPNAILSAINYEPQSYTESGAGGADLHIAGKDLNLVQVGAGVKAGWQFKYPNFGI